MEAGLTQSDLVKYGILRSYYCRVEEGLHSLTIEKLAVLAKAFGCCPSDFFKDKDGEEISF